MAGNAHRKARIISVIAATFVSLACGTNYAYSAWAPQFAERLQLSSTQSNFIGTFGNVGMYASGMPIGLLIDRRGPRLAFLLGAAFLGSGYYPLRKAYDDGPGQHSVELLCFFAFLTGCGSCSAFSATLKTVTINWPQHRGTATAFPLGGFGLSAFFFTMLSGFAFPDNTSDYLLTLAIGTFTLILLSSLFLRVLPPPTSYAALPTHEQRPPLSRKDSNPLQQTKSRESSHVASRLVDEPEPDETSSLMSKTSSGPGDIADDDTTSKPAAEDSHCADITGLALLQRVEFWQLWMLLGVLTGVGIMTINNIGSDALWEHYDDSASPSFIHERQLMHVSVLSFLSFCGRILSGIGSDLLVKKLHMSRFWCVTTSATIFAAAQLCAVRIANPNFLLAVSGLTGIAYGTLFGVFPALVADTFGVRGMSLNWGFLTFACVVWGWIFNFSYGRVFDHHSVIQPGGKRDCPEGLNCYATAYWITFFASVAALVISLWSIRYEHWRKRQPTAMERRRSGSSR